MDASRNVVDLIRKVFSRMGLAFFLVAVLGTVSALGSASGETPGVKSPLAEMPAFGGVTPGATAELPQNRAKSGVTCQILPNPQGHYTAFVFDAVRGVLAVYMIDSSTGQINLKSVRQVSWDLRLEEFNTNQPLPSDLRDSQR